MFGCTHETAEDGRQAVERATIAPFDLILMDVKMPVMDGVAATRAIRALPGPASAVPILALTANADPRDEAEYLAAGMDGWRKSRSSLTPCSTPSGWRCRDMRWPRRLS